MSRVPGLALGGDIEMSARPGELGWDYCLVFNDNPDESEEVQEERALVLKKLKASGLLVGKMTRHGEVFVLVTATKDRLMEEADRRGIEMQLKEEYKDKLTGSAGYAEFSLVKQHMFAGTERPRYFTSLERQRLLLAIFEASKADHGCGLNVDELKPRLFTGLFPLHEQSARDELMRVWAKQWRWQPLDQIRDYFGEKIAMYFAFLGTYTTWLFGLSLVGLVAQILQIVENDADHPIIPFYCLVLSLWTTFFLEAWKRQQSVQAFLWDVQDFEEEESVRPEFVGNVQKGLWVGDNFITEQEIAATGVDAEELSDTKYFPTWKRALRYTFSAPVIGSFLVAVVAGTVGILVFRGVIAMPPPTGLGKTGQVLGGMLNAMFITAMNIVYKKVAVWLNKFENHRTDTNYEDALISKVFLFQFVNSYISLFYIAFMKGHHLTIFGMDTGKCRRSCLDEMSTQLLSLVVIMQVVGNFKELGIPYLKGKVKAYAKFFKFRKQQEAEGVDAAEVPAEFTRYEVESHMEPYPGTFDDYNELAIQFGYVTLFAAAFPIASFASFLNNIVEIRSDALKLLVHTQRPNYMGCEDIGSWEKVFTVLSTLSVITNVCIIGFTSLILSGKCEFKRDYPPGCKGSDCVYFKHDAIRAVHTGYTAHIGQDTFEVDCANSRHENMCCPVVMADGHPVLEEATHTMFMTPYDVLLFVVVVEHALLFIRSVLAELIPDVPGWVVKAQARLDLQKDQAMKTLQGETPRTARGTAKEQWDFKPEHAVIDELEPTPEDF